jgi:glycerate-2-kinase
MTLDSADGITILAAGTDGRDGPTDAAGAIIDGSTCSAMRDRGIDPSTTLLRHDSYNALDSVGALLKTGSTGTNVNDIVISLVSPRP